MDQYGTPLENELRKVYFRLKPVTSTAKCRPNDMVYGVLEVVNESRLEMLVYVKNLMKGKAPQKHPMFGYHMKPNSTSMIMDFGLRGDRFNVQLPYRLYKKFGFMLFAVDYAVQIDGMVIPCYGSVRE